MSNITIILPTYNEADSVVQMIKRIKKLNPAYDICVVDSSSTDGTAEKAASQNVKIINIDERGKGIAIKKAFAEIDSEILILLDSDSSYLPEEIPKLLEALTKCDAVVGSRFKGTIMPNSMKSINKFGNIMLTKLANFLYNYPISDVCSGFWAFKKNTYKRLDIDAKHFTLEANFYIECTKKKIKLCEVPITYATRIGETKLNIFHGVEIALYLLKKRFF